MRLSEERISELAKSISDSLLDEEHVDLEIAEDRFQDFVEAMILKDLQTEDEIDEEAAGWLHKNKPYLEDGSPEFEVELERTKKDLAASRGYVLY